MAASQSFATTFTSFASEASAQVPLPPASTFDILPALHELFSRIDHSSNDPLATTSLLTSSDTTNEVAYSDSKPLEPKDLPREAGEIKARIRKALRELEKLPDMDRTVEEQQEEIEMLEARISRQQEALKRLGIVAAGVEERLRGS